MRLRRSWLIGSGITLAALPVTCSGNSALTVEVYAAWCGGTEIEEPAWDDTTTWGEVSDFYSAVLDKARDINPPDVLKDYHRANRESVVALKAVADSKSADRPPTRRTWWAWG